MEEFNSFPKFQERKGHSDIAHREQRNDAIKQQFYDEILNKKLTILVFCKQCYRKLANDRISLKVCRSFSIIEWQTPYEWRKYSTPGKIHAKWPRLNKLLQNSNYYPRTIKHIKTIPFWAINIFLWLFFCSSSL